MTIEKASLRPNECFEGHFVFFLKKRKIFEFFPALERRMVILWRRISNRLSKMRFICLEEVFQGDCLFSEKKIKFLVISLKIWADFSEKFRKRGFWREIIGTFVTTGFHGSRGTLCGIFLPGNESFARTFSQLERKFVTFCQKNSADSWKVHHGVQMILLRRNLCSFGGIIVYKCFSVV